MPSGTTTKYVRQGQSVEPESHIALLTRVLQAITVLMSALVENGALSSAAVAIATTTSKVQSVATCVYRVAGKIYSKAATDNLWTLSGTTVAVSSFQKYLLCLSTAGAASIIECTQAATAAGVTLPTTLVPDGAAPVAWILVATDASHTFTPGTTALGAAGITTTYSNGFDNALAASCYMTALE